MTALYLTQASESLSIDASLPFLATATNLNTTTFTFAIAHNDSATPTYYAESANWLYSSDNQLLFSSDNQILEGAA